jgi:hypothetical protein
MAKPELLAMTRTKMLAELSERFGFTIKRYVIDNPLKRKPAPGTTDSHWLTRQIASNLQAAGHTGLKPADLNSVETVLKALKKRLLPPPAEEAFTVRIAFTADRVIIGKREYPLHSTASGRPRIGRGNHKLPADALLALLREAKAG